jgi:rsbT antagonist protein RsbS
VIVGINPDVAFAMVELGTDLGSIITALDMEEGLQLLKTTTAMDQFQPARGSDSGPG